MSDYILVKYTLPKYFFDLITKENDYSSYTKERNYEYGDGSYIVVSTSISYDEEDKFEKIMESFEIPYNAEYSGDYGMNAGEKEVRFETKNEKGSVLKRESQWDKNHKYSVDAIVISVLLESGNIEKAQEILNKTMTENTSECTLINARIPSQDRMMLLAVNNHCDEVVKILYDNGADINYKDRKSGITTFKIIEKDNGKLLSYIKKCLLNKHQSDRDNNISMNDFSL